MKRLIAIITLLTSVLSLQAERLTDYVNPFIGTAATGHTFPGACVPFGLVQASPWTGAVGWEYCTGYVYSDPKIWGFAQTCLNGTGCADLGDILIQPVMLPSRGWDAPASDRECREGAFSSTYQKSSETARPGYYAVTLDNGNIRCEATATEHVGCYRFTYPTEEKTPMHAQYGLYIDLQHGPAWRENQYYEHITQCEVNVENPSTISGHVRSNIWVEQDVYFVMEFSQPFHRLVDRQLRPEEKGRKLLVEFDSQRPLEVHVALSSKSIAGAMRNLKKEVRSLNKPSRSRVPGRPVFDLVRQQADEAWEQQLQRIRIEGSKEQKTSFYTSLYHALIQPNNIADAGERPDYSTFSCWDTYRAAHPFYTLAFPDRVDDFVQSLVNHVDSAGILSVWELWGKDNYCMIGNHAVGIIAEAYHKGFRGFDTERAWEAIKRTLTVDHEPKSQWSIYTKYGYFPTDMTESESVSRTLECSYDDYAAADMARLMGKKEDAAYFADRATWYQHLFDKETGFMRPRLADGTWKSPFDPAGLAHAESVGGDYTEGNAWQYTWHVLHDVPGLILLLGGKKAFCKRLDTFFNTRLDANLADVTGLIGQYAHGNEPSHHVAYLYALAGQPHRTQELVRQICDELYLPRPDGLSGNDDCGQMSAWYMLSSMGIYAVSPVSGEYVFGAPQLPRIELSLPAGKKLTIVAKNLSAQNKYVKRILWNGRPYKAATIDHSVLTKGGTLTFEMTDKY
ncbi:MAG: GH92 family glycosyl hydrolase [Bacteroidaceae bacterium]|nr:GH92 family glycosyl hydrolase [Bacteroidaceae bacterium]